MSAPEILKAIEKRAEGLAMHFADTRDDLCDRDCRDKLLELMGFIRGSCEAARIVERADRDRIMGYIPEMGSPPQDFDGTQSPDAPKDVSKESTV